MTLLPFLDSLQNLFWQEMTKDSHTHKKNPTTQKNKQKKSDKI